MKKIISLTFVLSLFIFSCSSNENQDNSNSGPILLRKTITTNSQGTITTNINYNGNKIINAISSNGYEDKFYYAGNLITKHEVYNNNILVRTVLYNYNSQNNLTSSIELNNNNNQGTKTTLTYNSNGTITYNMYSGDLSTQTSLWGTYTATLTNSEITLFEDENTNYFDTCTYDLNNTPSKNILGMEQISMAIGSGTYRNIAGKFQNLIEQKTTTQAGIQYTFKNNQYTYNSNNFPTTAIMKTYSSNGTITGSSNVSYFYE